MKDGDKEKSDKRAQASAEAGGRSNVIRVDAFLDKKRDAENRRALEKVLSRADKLNW